jgi:NAD(P)-dependent dehydrogenase (short-subunit alcohol dehydrogenase family)
MQLKGKVAIVTGGAAGIGQAIAERFAEEGATVLVLDIDSENLQALEIAARKKGHDIKGVLTDISDEQTVERNITEITEQYSSVDILVNNAARFVLKGIEAESQDWHNSLNVNVCGTAYCTKYTARSMKSHGGGAIVNIASISGVVAQPDFVTYSTTKAAIIQMTKNTALDLGQYGIRVNCVSPGTIITAATKKHVKKLGITMNEFEHLESEKTVLKKVGRPREVASAVLFLASSEASYISGVNLMVDGGYTTV